VTYLSPSVCVCARARTHVHACVDENVMTLGTAMPVPTSAGLSLDDKS